jgi:prolyl-tRNA editing enzyme YbaK/EbsC (Cys-tRNA(Pro) deacylase)
MSQSTILERIRQLLIDNEASFREIQHEPTFTSQESARARREDLEIGGKALLMKGGDRFFLFVLPANRKVNSSAIRQEFKFKKLRFASRSELEELTGLQPGAIPPFGEPIFPFELCVDSGIRENDRIAFNAGSLTDSIVLSVDDYLAAARPCKVFQFSLKDESTEADGSSDSSDSR